MGTVRGMDSGRMLGFGHKQAWLAVRDTEPGAIIAAIGLRDLGPVSWRDGLDVAYVTDDRVILTPPLPGARHATWVLAVGRWWLTGGAVDTVTLSRDLDTEVQYFATSRTEEWHHWERAVAGVLVRRFSFLGQSGEVTAWRGDPDATEVALGLPTEPEDRDILIAESDVMRVAGAWSVDPSALDGQPAPGPLRVAAAR